MDDETAKMLGLGGGDDTDKDSGSSWESWFQKASQTVMNGYGQKQQYQQNFELKKLQLQAQNPFGQMYAEGRPTMGGAGGISPMMLLLIGGAVIAAVVFLKD